MMNISLIQIHPELEKPPTSPRQHLDRRAANFGSDPHAADPLRLALDRLTHLPRLTLAVLLLARRNMTLPVVIWSIWLSGGFGSRGIDDGDAMHLVPIIALYGLSPPIRHRPARYVICFSPPLAV